MFGSSTKKPQENKKSMATSTPNAGGINMLVHGTSVEGTIKADNDIRIDGELKGHLYCKGKLIIGPTGKIEGEVVCTNAVVEGQFEGTMKVEEILSVRETARITGDITTDKLTVQSGATFNVTCAMGGQKTTRTSASQAQPSSKVAAEMKLN
jgi:cytoskeletal protein CcmA (bactofilin family)